jgi:hypothetical protein
VRWKFVAATAAFVEVQEAPGAWRCGGVIEVRPRGGRWLLVRRATFGRAFLVEVVAALESLPCEVEATS